MTKKRDDIPPEDRDLWAEINKGIKPLKTKKKLGIAVQDLKRFFYKEHHARFQVPKKPSVCCPPTVSIATDLPTLKDPTLPRKIRKRKISVEASLDLHGMTQQQAYQSLIIFINNCQRQHKRCVLIITGKGSSRDSPGILKQQVPLWLGSPPLQQQVISLSDAHIHDGGQGAIYVLIRKYVAI